MANRLKIGAAVVLVVAALATTAIYFSSANPPKTKLNIEVADDELERQRGLSGRPSIETNSGLLFIFPTLDYHGIWMKDMVFAIDIIWLDQDHKVVYIEKAVSPSTYPHIFKPTQLALYVLEVNAGVADARGFKVGDKLEL